ncbi:glycosyltransferase family 2 protein [Methylocaldum sp. MU1018]
MNATPKTAIVVLNWNGKADTLACLDSLRQMDYPAHRVIVVDNGSSDDSVAAIREAHPWVHLIENGTNLGFAGGNNVGIRAALRDDAEFMLILNNDTEVAPDFLKALTEEAMRQPQAGVLAPKIYYYDQPDRIWYGGGRWNAAKRRFEQIGDGEPDCGQYDAVGETEFIVGCAMLIRASVFREIGLLDERFFLNYEEIDFCGRARQAGWRLVYVPKARLWHKISVSFGGEESPLKLYFTFRNRLLWAGKALPPAARLALHWSVYRAFVSRFLEPVLHAFRRGPRSAAWTLKSVLRSPLNRAWYKGIRDYWRGRFGICPQDVWDLQAEWKTMRRSVEAGRPAND